MNKILNSLKSFSKYSQLSDQKMVILVRTDLPMGKGKVATQCAHAAVSLYKIASEKSQTELDWWICNGQPKIVLKVSENCEKTLQDLYQMAKNSGLNACRIHDAGRTQIMKGTLTAVGIGPNSKEDVNKITKEFKLL